MQKILLSLALVVCALAAVEAAKKIPKPVRTLKILCERAGRDRLIIKDGNFTEVFEMLADDFCDDFLAMYNSTYPSSKMGKFDPIKSLGSVCRWVMKKYDAEPEGLLNGIYEICEEYEMAVNASLGLPIYGGDDDDEPFDGNPPPKVNKLVGLCMKAEAGKLRYNNASFDYVFEDFTEWCGDFLDIMDATKDTDSKMKKNSIVVLGGICEWFDKQYPEGDDDGPLDGFDDICDDFDMVLNGP